MSRESKKECETAVTALRGRLDYGIQALASQDFRHLRQVSREKVADFITWLKRTFKQAYGRDTMQQETRDMLLFAQLQEGLKLYLTEAPAVSGATTYMALCLASKKRLLELKRCKQYSGVSGASNRKTTNQVSEQHRTMKKDLSTARDSKSTKCWSCGKLGHLSKEDCKLRQEEHKQSTSTKAGAKQNLTEGVAQSTDDPRQYLLSDSEDEGSVSVIKLKDGGSQPQRAPVDVQGMTILGVVETRADISIIGG